MHIDIFTFVSQIINFLVLLFILNKLAYKPILKAMKERNNQIKNTIDEADNKLKEAEETRSKYEIELRNIENYKEEQIAVINSDLNNYKSDEITKLKSELQKQKDSFDKQLDNEKDMIIEELIKRFYFNIDDFLTDMFSSLSDSSLNATILKKFLNEIKNMDSSNVNKMNRSGKGNLDFFSSFELTDEDKKTIKNTFEEKGILFDNINFIIDKDMIIGNKISINGVILNSNLRNIINNFTIKLKSTL